jgi:hypothetical protein
MARTSLIGLASFGRRLGRTRLCRSLRSFLSSSFLLAFLFLALLCSSFTFLRLAFLTVAPLLVFAPLLYLSSHSHGSGPLFLFLALACLFRLLLCQLCCSALLRLTFGGAVILFLFSFNVLRHITLR